MDVATITEGRRALELLCDRLTERARFIQCVNQEPARRHILVLHGDGGHGKSLLLQHLASHLCHYALYERQFDGRPEDVLRRFEQVVAHEHQRTAVPHVTLDFSVPPQGTYNPLEPAAALGYVRRMLVKHGFRFPLFDYAITLQMFRTGRLTQNAIQDALGTEALGTIKEVIDLLLAVPAASAVGRVVGVLTGGIQGELATWARERTLDRAEVERLAELDPLCDLPGELPCLFAEDLNAAMSSADPPHRRLVLFFDALEAFPKVSRGLSPGDTWLRRLLGTLRPDVGIVAVVAGRDVPSWDAAALHPVAAGDMELCPVGSLLAGDADEYLRRAGIASAELRAAICSVCDVEPGQYHPLYLGFCADIVLNPQAGRAALDVQAFAAEGFAADVPDRDQRSRLLIDRLLQYCSDDVVDVIHCVAAARSFDFEAFDALGRVLRFRTDHVDFQRLTNFSFIRPAPENRFKVHALMRRILRSRGEARTRAADMALEAWYAEKHRRGDLLAIAESLYHAAQIDGQRAATAWLGVFSEATGLSGHPLCLALIDLLDEMGGASIDLRCRAWNRIGDHHLRISDPRSQEAYRRAAHLAQRWLEGTPSDPAVGVRARIEWGRALQGQGDWHALRGEAPAPALFQEAIRVQKEASRDAPSDATLNHHLGGSYHRLAEWFGASGDGNSAANFALAIESYRTSLSSPVPDLETPQSTGLAYLALADCQAALGGDDARGSYETAIGLLDTLLEAHPADLRTLACLGNACQGLGEHLGRWQDEGAEAPLRRAVAAYERIVAHAPGAVDSHLNLGVVRRRLAEWSYRQKHPLLHGTFEASIDALKQALALAPHAVSACISLGGTHRSYADSLSGERDDRAMTQYMLARDAYLRAIELAPTDATVHNSLGLVQRSLARDGPAGEVGSLEPLEQALRSFARAARLAPLRAHAHRNLAITHRMMADHLVAVRKPGAALHYTHAVKAFHRAMRRAGRSADLLNGVGLAFSGLGVLQEKIAPDAAIRSLDKAIDVLTEAIGHEPGAVNLRNNLADAWMARAGLLAAQASDEDAVVAIDAAVSNYEAALAIDRNDVYAIERLVTARRTLGASLERLAGPPPSAPA